MEVFEVRTLLSGVTFTVDTFLDSVDANIGDGVAGDAGGNVSLRAAIQEANVTADDVMIILPAGTYTLTIPGQDEDSAVTGDLDVGVQGGTFNRSVQGAGEALTIIDGNGLDRVFHVMSGAILSLSDLTVRGGQAAGFDGGGIHSAGILNLSDTIVTGNTGLDNGGGLYLADGAAFLFETKVDGNTVTQNGAGIHVAEAAFLEMSGGRVDGNTANGQGGGIFSLGQANIKRTEVSHNAAGTNGGGISAQSGGVTLAGAVVRQNSASQNGGGLSLSGTGSAEIRFSEIRDNSAVAGGGVMNSSTDTLMLYGVTIAGGNAGSGAGIFVTAGSTNIVNSTLSDNTATADGGGLQSVSGTVELQSSTIVQNTAATGAGIDVGPQSSVRVRNSIIALNTATMQEDDVSATNGVLSQGFNLIGTGGPGFVAGIKNDLVGTPGSPVDPLLGPLADNGGGLRTHEPLQGSPAINAGNHLAPTPETDQRGVPRDLSGPGVVDIGAVETGFTGFFVDTTEDTVDLTPGDGNASDAMGNTSLRAAIQEANALGGIQTVIVPAGHYRLDLAGADEELAATGDLDISDDLIIHGQGADATRIDGRSLDRVFDVNQSTVAISDLSVDSGNTTGQVNGEGGGLRMVDSSVTLNRLTFQNNTAVSRGGAIFDQKNGLPGTLVINQSSFFGSTAGEGGAIYVENDSVSINGSRIDSSQAITGSGGAIYSRDGQVTVSDSLIDEGSAVGQGGAIYSDKTGGGLAPGFVSIIRSRIEDSSAETGGAVHGNGDSLSVQDSEIVANVARTGNGGGIENIGGQLTVTGSRIEGNLLSGMLSPSGAGISSSGAMALLTVSGSQISSNSTQFGGFGGGIAGTSPMVIVESTIRGNQASQGGGIHHSSTLMVENSTVTQNLADGVVGEGGGIYSDAGSTATIASSTVTQNLAVISGGGLFVSPAGEGPATSATLKNTILAGNEGTDLFGAGLSDGNNIIGDLGAGSGFTHGVAGDLVGGEIGMALTAATNSGPIQVTVADHGLATGDRVRINGVLGNTNANGTSSVTVVNVNQFTLDGSMGNGAYTSGGTVFRLIDPRLGTANDNLATVPMISNPGPVRFQPGPTPFLDPVTAVRTETHLLLSGSPAIDAGSNTGAPATDQRGLARPTDGDGDSTATVDIGAVELFYGSVSGTVFDDLNGNGQRDSGEPGLAGASVYHDANQNGIHDPSEQTVQTAPDDPGTQAMNEAGTFLFAQLPPGPTVIGQVPDMNFRVTTPASLAFSTPLPLADVSSPRDILVDDVNNDGNLDVVVLRSSNDLQVGLGDEQGMLVSTATYAVGIDPVSVTATDLNGDGQLDLVVANRGSDDLSILTNSGAGQFGMATSVAVGMSPEAVVSGQFNGDSSLDIAVANGGSDSVMILSGNGMGGLSTAATVMVGAMPVDLAVLDFDGDMLVDLVTVNHDDDTISLIRNTGGGTFSAAMSFSTASQPLAIAAGDLNRDGFDDIAVATAGDVRFRLSTGTTFDPATVIGSVAAPSDIAVLDFNGDGTPGFAVTSSSANGTVTVFENSAGNISAGSAFSTGSGAQSIAGLDTDIDGKHELIIANAGSSDVVYLANLTGSSFVNVQTNATASVAESGGVFPGSISGTKFNDLNQDGTQGPGEPGLEGFTIYIDQNENGQFDMGENSVVTGVDGTFTLAGVNAAVPVIVREVQNPGFTQTFPDALALHVTGGVTLHGGIRPPSIGELVAAGDLNGDGDGDVVVANPTADTVSVFHFIENMPTARIDLPVGMAPVAVHLSDVNADGRPDILTANHESGDVSVIINQGNGSYAAASHFGAGSTPQSLTTGDFDGDASPDIAVSNSTSGDVQILINNRFGSFANPVAINLSEATSGESIEAGDFDGDGDADLAVVSGDLNGVVVLRNLGGLSFQELPDVEVGALPAGAATGDLDSDGDLDLVVANSTDGTVQFLLNDGSGGLTAGAPINVGGSPEAVTLGDIDDDGNLDAVVANQTLPEVSILLGDGAGGVDSHVARNVGGNQDGVVVLEFLGNEHPGIIATLFQTGMATALSNLTGTHPLALTSGQDLTGIDFGSVNLPGEVSGLKYHDLNEDGTRDPGEPGLPGVTIYADVNNNDVLDPGEPLAVTGADGTYTITGLTAPMEYTISEQLPPGFVQFDPVDVEFAAAGRIDGVVSPFSIQSADLNNNGRTDLVVSSEDTGTVQVLLRNVDGTYAAPVTYGAGTTPGASVLQDFNGDLRPDIAVVNEGSGNVSVLLNAGDGTFAAADQYATGLEPVGIIAADVTGDTAVDLIVAALESDQVFILPGDGMGGFLAASSFSTGAMSEPSDLTAGLFDGDADLDLAVILEGTNQVQVYLNDGNGAFIANGAPVSVGTDPVEVIGGDLNNDLIVDLAVLNSGSNTVSILEGTGEGIFLPPTSFATGIRPESISILDADVDGDPDLVVTNEGSGDVTLLTNDGGGAFLPSTGPSQGGVPTSVTVLNVNSDGEPDIAVTSEDDSIRLLVNTRFSHRVFVESGASVSGRDFGNREINDPPTVTVAATAAVDEDSPLVFGTGEFVISDPDASPGVLEIELNVTNGTLTLSGTSGLSFLTGGNATSAMKLTGLVGDINLALDGLLYSPPADFHGSSLLQVTVDDQGNTGFGGAMSVTDVVDITVNPVNDVPVLAGVPLSVVDYTENDNATLLAPMATVSDVDNTQLASAVIQFVDNYQATGDVLAADVTGTNINAIFDQVTGTLNLVGADTLANYQNVLRTVSYRSTSENPTAARRTVGLILNDGNQGGLPVEREIDVTPVNDAPEFGAQPPPLSIDENSNAGTVVHTVVVTDVDSAGDLVLSIAAGNTGNAFLIDPVTGQITVNDPAALDFETTGSFVLQILVTDGAPVAPTPLTAQQNITINVVDLVEPFVIGSNAFDSGGVTLVRDGGSLRALRTGTMNDVVPPAAFASVASVTVDGRMNDADQLTVDFSAGDPIPDGGLVYSGNSGTGIDSLILTGGNATTVAHTFLMSKGGSLVIDGQSIVYDGLESVADLLTAQNRSFHSGNTSDTVILSDNGVPADGRSSVTLPVTGNSVDFSHPSGSLSFQLGGGDDDLQTSSFDTTFAANLLVSGADGNDNLSLAGFAAGSVTVDGGPGDDTITGGSGDDLHIGGAGADEFLSSPGDDVMQGGAGTDVFVDGIDDGDDTFHGGSEEDLVVLTAESVNQVDIHVASGDTGQVEAITGTGSSDVTFDGTETVIVDSPVQQTLTVSYTDFMLGISATLTELDGSASITGPGLVDVEFGTDSGDVAIDGGQGNDVLTVTGLQLLSSGLNINGGAGIDQTNVPGGLPAAGLNSGIRFGTEMSQIAGLIRSTTGPVTFDGAVTLTGDANIDGIQTIFAESVMTGMNVLTVVGGSQFSGPGFLNGTFQLNGDASFTGPIDVNGPMLNVTGNAVFAAATTLEGAVTFGGEATFSAPLDVKGTVTAGNAVLRLQADTVLQNGSIISTGPVHVGAVGQIEGGPSISLSGEGVLDANSLILSGGAILHPAPVIQTGPLTFEAGSSFDASEPGGVMGMGMPNPIPLTVSGALELGGAEFLRVEGQSVPFSSRILIEHDAEGAVLGTFAGLPDATGVDVPVSVMGQITESRRYVMNYQGGDGNDVEIVPAASITGLVFSDVAAQDGIHDVLNEPVQSGVTVELMDDAGTVLRQTTTDGNGIYLFDDLLPGEYRVHFVAPDTQHFTDRNQGIDDTIDSDPNILTGEVGILDLQPGEDRANVDAGLVETTIAIIDPIPVNEGDTPPDSVLSFTVVLNGRTPHQVTVNAQVVQGTDGQPVATASTENDVQLFANPGGLLPVIFNPGQVEQTVTVPIVGDLDEEADEGFVVQLSNPVQATLDDAVGFGLIRNDDFADPVVVLGEDVSVVENQFPNRPGLEFSVVLQGGAVAEDLLISYRTVDDGTGIAMGSPVGIGQQPDYVPVSNQVLILPAGQTSATFQIQVNGDGEFEADEHLTVELISVSSVGQTEVNLGPRTQATGFIENDDVTAPTVSVGDAVSVEADHPAVAVLEFPVTLDGPAVTETQLTFSTVELSGPGTATAGEDYLPFEMQTLSIPAGQTRATITVTIPGDQFDEDDEVFAVELTGISTGNVVPGETIAVGTILNDDDPALRASIRPVGSVSEGRVGQITGFEFEVSLSGAAQEPVDVFVSTIDPASGAISAATPGDDPLQPNIDYLRFDGRSVRIPAGQRSGTFHVDVVGDESPEPDEILIVQIVNTSTGIEIDDQQQTAVGIVVNDDGLQPIVRIDSTVSTHETRPGLAKAVSIPVRLSIPSSEIVTVEFETVEPVPGVGIATAGDDFQARTGTLTFAPGQQLEFIQVLVDGDMNAESPELFAVDLTGVSNNASLDSIATRSVVTVLDGSELLPFVSIQQSETVDEMDSNRLTPVELTVTLGGRLNTDVVVGYTIPDAFVPGYATADADYLPVERGEVVIRKGQSEATLTVLVAGDLIQEPQEQFFVQLLDVTPNAQIDLSSQQSTVTILDNDAALPTVRISDARVREGDCSAGSGMVAAVEDPRLDFVISLSSVPEGPVSVEVETGRVFDAPPGVAGTEGQHKDVFRTRRTLFFDSKNTSRLFSVRVTPDDVFEADELVFVNVFNPVGAVLPGGILTGVGTIIDDDSLSPTVSISSTRLLEGDSPDEVVAALTVTLESGVEPGSSGETGCPPGGGTPGSGNTAAGNSASSSSLDVEVGFRTVALTATEGVDYVPVEGTLVFSNGIRALTIEIPIIGELEDEFVEEFFVELFDVDGVAPPEFNLEAFQGLVRIDNDDAPDARFSIDSVQEREGTGADTLFEFSVRRIGNPDQTSSVDFSTSAGSAQSEIDFLTQTGTLTFAPDGPDVQTIQVSVVGDDIAERKRETFFVTLSHPINGVVAARAGQGIGTIFDDDRRVFDEDAQEELINISNELMNEVAQVGDDPNNPDVLNLLDELNRDAIGRLGPSLLITFDPVDFTLTDLLGRTVGYTESDGVVTEIPLTFYSGDGDVELVVIPAAEQGIYGLQLSGVSTGEFRLAATLVTAEGYSETIFSAGTLSGNLELALDFTEQAVPLQSQVVEEMTAINNQRRRPVQVTNETFTLADEVAIDPDQFVIPDLEISRTVDPWVGWEAGAEILQTLSLILREWTGEVAGQFDMLPAVRIDASDSTSDQAAVKILDSVFSRIGDQAFGAPGAVLYNLVELIGSFDWRDENESSRDDENAEPTDGENEDRKENDAEGQGPDSAALEQILRMRRMVESGEHEPQFIRQPFIRQQRRNKLDGRGTPPDSARENDDSRVNSDRRNGPGSADRIRPQMDTERQVESSDGESAQENA